MPIALALGHARPVVEMKPPLTDKSECLVAIALTLLGAWHSSQTHKKNVRVRVQESLTEGIFRSNLVSFHFGCIFCI